MDYHQSKQYRRGKRMITIGACIIVLLAGGIGIHQYRHRSTSSPIRTALEHKETGVQYLSTKILPMSPGPQTTQGYANQAKSALIMNSRGDILYGKNIDKQRKVASTAKLMTLYLAQAKANRTHDWNNKIAIPSNLASMSSDAKDGTGAELHLKDGQSYTIEDLYKSALIESSNAAAVALGEWVGGTNSNFVHLMNQQAKAWHMKAHFISASGLENDSISKFGLRVAGGKDSGNSMSARDLAIVAQHLLHDFPSITKWSSKKSMKVDGTVISNMNYNLPGQVHGVYGCDGLKTGFTPDAGFCFVGTKREGTGHRIIVLLGDNNNSLFNDGHELLAGQATPRPRRPKVHLRKAEPQQTRPAKKHIRHARPARRKVVQHIHFVHQAPAKNNNRAQKVNRPKHRK